MLFSWYKDDFETKDNLDNGNSLPEYAVLQWIKENGGIPQIRDRLHNMMSNGKFAVEFAPYDWNLNQQ